VAIQGPPPQPFDPPDRRVASLLATTIPSKRDAHVHPVFPDQEPSFGCGVCPLGGITLTLVLSSGIAQI
jgi:hypothetical protein